METVEESDQDQQQAALIEEGKDQLCTIIINTLIHRYPSPWQLLLMYSMCRVTCKPYTIFVMATATDLCIKGLC